MPFAVKVLNGDGVTPVVGEAVTFSATAGRRSSLLAERQVAPSAPIREWHCVDAGYSDWWRARLRCRQAAVGWHGECVLHCGDGVQAVTAVQAVEYVAAGVTLMWTPQVSVARQFASTAGLPLAGSRLSGRCAVSPAQSQWTGRGVASDHCNGWPAWRLGTQASLSGCAWTNVCARFTTQGVDPADLRVVAVSGANQMRRCERYAFARWSCRLRIRRLILWRALRFRSTRRWTRGRLPCPNRGRCPIAPVLASSQISATSDANGLLTMTPAADSGSGRDHESRRGHRDAGLYFACVAEAALDSLGRRSFC